ncbi:MAG TPA: GNAT family N-acetyltransferase [Longimicrobiaceae bacterium]|nr:GNAT family N-acetyltransferase [Longimicrobiaceae bacterium]
MNRMALRIERFAPGDARTADFAAVRERIGYPVPDEDVPSHAECLVAYAGSTPVARLAVEVAPELHDAPGPSGLAGWYETVDGEAGTALLVRAREMLAERGVARVLGPMNGSTWKRYRLALAPAPGEAAPRPFLTEPVNPPEYPAHFEAAGFTVAAEYESRLAVRPDGWSDEPEDEGRDDGITVSPLDPAHFDEALREIHDLSLAAFSRNPYYTPTGFDEFASAYRKARPLLDPALVRLARGADGRLLAFVFAFPDALDRAPGRPPRVVLKTLATAPEARGLGLGGRLTGEVHRAAFARGAPAVVHALMHVQNTSQRISGHFHGEPFRRYALYGRTP